MCYRHVCRLSCGCKHIMTSVEGYVMICLNMRVCDKYYAKGQLVLLQLMHIITRLSSLSNSVQVTAKFKINFFHTQVTSSLLNNNITVEISEPRQKQNHKFLRCIPQVCCICFYIESFTSLMNFIRASYYLYRFLIFCFIVFPYLEKIACFLLVLCRFRHSA